MGGILTLCVSSSVGDHEACNSNFYDDVGCFDVGGLLFLDAKLRYTTAGYIGLNRCLKDNNQL